MQVHRQEVGVAKPQHAAGEMKQTGAEKQTSPRLLDSDLTDKSSSEHQEHKHALPGG